MLLFLQIDDNVHVNANNIEAIDIRIDDKSKSKFALVVMESGECYRCDDIGGLFVKLRNLAFAEKEQ